MRNTAKKLNVSFLYDDSLDGNEGVAQYVKTLGSWLSSRGHKVSYLVGQTKISEYDGGKVFSLSKNSKVVFNGNRLSIPWPASKRKINIALKTASPDIIHVQVPYSPFLAQKVINANKRAAVVGTFHIFPASRLVKFSGHLLKLTYGRSLKRFVSMKSVSQPAQIFAQSTFGIKSQILPNMVDINAYQKHRQTYDPNKIVFVGRLVERKGCRYLIQAFANISKAKPELKLVIAGRGEQQAKLEALARTLKISDKVEFRGFISEEEKIKLLSSAAVACYPSLYGESFGIVLIEAMAANSAVVLAGNNPGYASVLEGRTEVLVNPKNTTEFEEKLNNILNDNILRGGLKKWQSDLVKKYDVKTVGPQVEEWYAQAIANNFKKSNN